MNDSEEKFTRDMVDGIGELINENKELTILSCPKCSGTAKLFRSKEDMNHVTCICEKCGKLGEGRIF